MLLGVRATMWFDIALHSTRDQTSYRQDTQTTDLNKHSGYVCLLTNVADNFFLFPRQLSRHFQCGCRLLRFMYKMATSLLHAIRSADLTYLLCCGRGAAGSHNAVQKLCGHHWSSCCFHHCQTASAQQWHADLHQCKQ